MSSKKNWRTGVAVLAAAGMVVVGVDYASYATTGHSLILGKDNTSSKTTTISRSGTGPALALDGKSALLKLSNTKKIAKLNADQVDGKSATDLNPALIRFTLGADGATLTAGEHYFTAKVPAGTYVVTMDGILASATSTDGYICATGDKDKLLANQLGGLFTYTTRSYSDTEGGFVDGVGVGTLKSGATFLYGCNLYGTGPFSMPKQVQFTLRKVSTTTKSGTPITVRNASPLASR